MPVFLGLCRSIGRCPSRNDTKDSLFIKLFPIKFKPPKIDLSQEPQNEYNCILNDNSSNNNNNNNGRRNITKSSTFDIENFVKKVPQGKCD